jgi:hypothetical protein
MPKVILAGPLKEFELPDQYSHWHLAIFALVSSSKSRGMCRPPLFDEHEIMDRPRSGSASRRSGAWPDRPEPG